MKIITFSILFFYLFSAGATSVKRYTIGVEDIPYMPFYQTSNGEFKGFAKELLDAFAKDNNIEFEYIPLPVKRLFKEYLNPKKHIDFKFPDNHYWAQDLKGDMQLSYSHGLVQFTDGVLRLKKNINTPKETLKDLGILRGFTAWGYLEDVKSGKINLVGSNSLESLLKLGIRERVDGCFINIDVAKYLLKNKIKKEGILFYDSSLPHTNSSYSLSTYQHHDIIKKLNKGKNCYCRWV